MIKKIANVLLKVCCNPRFYDDIRGDLEEEYRQDSSSKSSIKEMRYLSAVISLLRPSLIRPLVPNNKPNLMFPSHLKTAFRNLSKHKGQSVPILFGLVAAFVTCQLLFVAAQSEYQFDGFHKKKKELYRINYDEIKRGGEHPRMLPTVGPPTASFVKNNFSEVVRASTVRHSEGRIVSYQDKVFKENDLFYVDPDFLEMFDFEFIQGTKSGALKDVNSIVLTASTAKKYFGNETGLGKIVSLDNQTLYTVKGVVEDPPKQSSLQFDFLLPFRSFKVPAGYPVTLDSWGWVSFYAFVELKKDISVEDFEKRMDALIKTNFNEERSAAIDFTLQPITEMYFGEFWNGDLPHGNKKDADMLLLLALMVLLIAGFNFASLFLSFTVGRTKEMAIRALSGAKLGALWFQVVLDAIVLAYTSMLLATGISFLFMEVFHELVGWDLLFYKSQLVVLFLYSSILAVLVGVAAGIVPAVLIVQQSVSAALKGVFLASKSGNFVRRTLVVVQFSVTTFIIGFVLLFNAQQTFMTNRNLGFNKEGVVVMETFGEELNAHYTTLRHAFQSIPGVESISLSGESLDGDNGSVPFVLEGVAEEDANPIDILGVADGWLEMMEVPLLAGRYPVRRSKYDSIHAVVINKTAVDALGTKPEAILGKKVRVGGIVTDGIVIGVTEDFHFSSLHEQVAPVAILVPRTQVDKVYLKFNTTDLKSVIGAIENNSKKIMGGGVPLAFTFLDDALNKLYKKEKQMGHLIVAFSFLAIALSVIGLYGVTLYYIQSNQKNIGIKKVVGAGNWHLFLQFFSRFYWLILIGLVLAYPMVHQFGLQWLNNFAYHIEARLFYFFAQGALFSFVLAILVVALQFLKIVALNPTKVLVDD